MTLRWATLSSIFRVSIGETDNHEYDTQSDRHGLRSGASELSDCRGGCPRNPRANVLRLTGRDDMALGLAWSKLSCYQGGRLRSPRAGMLKLIDRDDMVVDVILSPT
ncbi:hypothetical protein B296_00038823 [Ensete ventricosum]|uniref:Uncharacterized protein n=1 Tax=Ensete ventricosum TaxID=4639 RepID=A0A426X8U8_ENSVE|nr:hypothetical protein B296_00038823 [Ensete ventricosum]